MDNLSGLPLVVPSTKYTERSSNRTGPAAQGYSTLLSIYHLAFPLTSSLVYPRFFLYLADILPIHHSIVSRAWQVPCVSLYVCSLSPATHKESWSKVKENSGELGRRTVQIRVRLFSSFSPSHVLRHLETQA